MGENSKIEWCQHTFNPWRGCTKVSAGCANCYAETMSKRNAKTLGVWGDNGTRVIASESYWRQPIKWDKAAAKAGERARVFCASLADVCEDRHELIAPRLRLKQLIIDTPNLNWLLLTKRPEQFLRLFWGPEWWPSNVWVGTSVENQATAEERIPQLLRCPASVRFLSCEPLLGPIDLTSIADTGLNAINALTGNFLRNGNVGEGACVDWVIVGGESGPGARPYVVEHCGDILDQCHKAGVAAFHKQLGSHPVTTNANIYDWPDGTEFEQWGDGVASAGIRLRDKKGGDMDAWPEDLRVRELPC